MSPQKSTKKAVAAPLPELQEPPAKKSRRPWYIALLVVGALLLGASITLVFVSSLSGWEQRAFEFINQASLPAWVTSQLAKPISNAVWGMVFLVAILLVVPKYRLLAWQYAVAAGSTYAVVFALEHLVDRARPVALESYEVVVRASQGGPGFPSGHVAVLTALSLTVWPFLSWPWRVLVLIFIAAEAWARIFLGLHAPLDIVGGLAIAVTVVAGIHLLPAKLLKFFRIAP